MHLQGVKGGELLKFIVIGSINMDFNFKVSHLPLKGETLKATVFKTTPGGKGANQAVALARLGGKVMMIGAVGSDEAGISLKKSLLQEGIDIKAIKDVDTPTGNAFITVDEKGNNTILVFPGANGGLDSKWIYNFTDEIKEASYVILQLEIPLCTVIDAIELSHKIGTRIILNPAPAQELPKEIFPQINILTPNETELALLTGIDVITEDDVLKASNILIEKGVQKVVVTLGEKGCFYMDRENHYFVKSFKVDSVDSTAAGDAFTAGFAIALAEQRSLNDTLKFANAVGALTVTKTGAQESLPFRADVENFLRMVKNEE